jgi:hypothetical protein
VIDPPRGQRTIKVTIQFYTDNIADEPGKALARHAADVGVVGLPANAAHGIKSGPGVHFNSMAELPAAIERALIRAGITIHTTFTASNYIRPRRARTPVPARAAD